MKILSITLLLIIAGGAQLIYAADQAEKLRLKQLLEQLRAPDLSEQEYKQQMLQQNPMFRQCTEIHDAFVRLEVSLYDRAGMQAHIAEERTKYNTRQRQILIDKMTYFSIPIRRTFREDAQDQLARLTINTMKECGRNDEIGVSGFGVIFHWLQNDDGTRSLECTVDAKPEILMAQYKE